MTAPNEREFAVFRRGETREDILRFFRNGLRALVNPKTGQSFTEDEVRRATTPGSRFYIEADATDLVAQGIQKRDEFLAQQMRVDRCGTAVLANYHLPQWGENYLPATGGSGNVLATGLPGTSWIGSTTIGDPFAVFARDPAGNRYQVLVTGTADGSGNASLILVGIDGGRATNIPVGTVLTWGNPPANSGPTCAVIGADFIGGGPAETDAEVSKRLAARIRRKPGAGNESQMRDIARAASNGVEDAFPYPCALNAGSTVVAITGKRQDAIGPNGRLPSVGALAAVTVALVPPGSPEIPARAFVVVVSPVAEATDLTLQVEQRTNSRQGWTDPEPFPPTSNTSGAPVQIAALTTQQDFTINLSGGDGLLPDGIDPATGVHLMAWDVATSRFEVLSVASITGTGGGVYRVTLSTPPSHTLASGDYISPGMLQSQADALAASVTGYFDSLGPGELVDLATSTLAVRAFRRPIPTEEWPQRVGQQLAQFVFEGLGAAVTDATVTVLGATTPSVPADPIDGPSLLTLGNFAVYPLE